MSDRHAVAVELALLKVIGEQLKAARARAEEQVSEWRPKDRAAAVLPGDAELGAVTLVTGRKTARLADATAFEEWVRRVHPEAMETETVTRPNPQFVTRLLSAAQKLGTPVDAETGEEVPGITVVQGDPYAMVRLVPGAAEVVAAAWQDNGLAELVASLLRPAPAVEGGDQ